MTQFDIIALILLGVSAAVGFFRGAVREIAALVALVAAAALAILGLPLFGPIARTFVPSGWLGTVLAVVAVFGVAFITLRLIGASIARKVQNTQMLGFLDRSLGLLIGLGRGLIVLGALYLMFIAATPEDLRPRWMTGARAWPLAIRMGGILERLAPQGLDIADGLKPAFERAVSDGSRDRSATDGYEAPEAPAQDHPERAR
jgi:membrane protein required for colicin V production